MSYFPWLAAILIGLVFCPVSPARAQSEVHILAFGDSLTAGYGLLASESFAAQLEQSLLDKGYAVRVTNAGVSGDTSADGLARVDWSLEDPPHLVILELGANDGLQGLKPQSMRENLETLIIKFKATGARVVLAGMQAPTNWGPLYRRAFGRVFPELAKKHKLALYPFFLEGVITDQTLLLDDGLHPNARGVAQIVQGILPLIEKELKTWP